VPSSGSSKVSPRPASGAVKLTPCDVQGLSARCGTFTVPENRAWPNGRMIDLNVVLVPAVHRPASPNAFTYLIGGPGGAATEMTSWVVQTFRSFHARQDILLVDQRGTGMSNTYAQSCLRSLNSDVRQYGTRNAMDDLDALRVALGYRQLDVYGASYGATAAQVYLKEHPSSVRTMVLDGATAIDVPFFGRFAVDAQSALDDVARRAPRALPAAPRSLIGARPSRGS
jgi:pimeloyl-ACP methyl ester carboxylesterase